MVQNLAEFGEYIYCCVNIRTVLYSLLYRIWQKFYFGEYIYGCVNIRMVSLSLWLKLKCMDYDECMATGGSMMII